MHRSRIGVVLVDHPTDVYDTTAAFWAGATGHDLAGQAAPPDDHPYDALGLLGGSLRLELQRTGPGTPSRVHLDIETDDVTAETARLLALGATVVEEREGYRIMADPGGLTFCVVPVQTDDFDLHAVNWSG
jgi:hypothetical protein